MHKVQVNPWTWQDSSRYSQAWRVDGAQSLVFISGQCPVDSDGQVIGANDFPAQARQTFQNLKTVLEQSGASFGDVVKLCIYLTDMSQLPELREVKSEFLPDKAPASTAIGVTALAIPGMMVEIDAIAVLSS